MVFVFALILTIVIFSPDFSSATRVQRCNSNEKDTIDNQVFISGCDEPPCKLQKNSTTNVEIIFEPGYDVSRLTTSVYAWVLSIPFPYLGIDGTSACSNLSLRNGTPTNCPIRKGVQYVYKNAVEIKAIYPKVKVILHWALVDPRNNANVFCFEVPVKIIN
ncbi:NPC intracellular cholesterol transporter 2-like isoform X1 [Planococcus citri]|uniref:NPC intracellular cholesterol transporter 2-like isoform X1 n=1 Tax=Planococcus citri TaxID=170843 RepID=UPI0031F87DCA